MASRTTQVVAWIGCFFPCAFAGKGSGAHGSLLLQLHCAWGATSFKTLSSISIGISLALVGCILLLGVMLWKCLAKRPDMGEHKYEAVPLSRTESSDAEIVAACDIEAPAEEEEVKLPLKPASAEEFDMFKRVFEVNTEHEDLEPLLRQYEAKKMKIKLEMERVSSKTGLTFVGRVKTALHDSSCPKSDDSCNEALLLHGTKAEHVLGLAFQGVSARLSAGLFGQGAYFAEDAGKADQYCTPLAPDAHPQLIQMLYTDCRKPPPKEDVYFILVCAVALGLPLHTMDGTTSMKNPPVDVGLPAGSQLWAHHDFRELVQVDSIYPPMHYHSLVAECGYAPEFKVKWFREFVCFDGTATLPRYIVAYTRQ